MQRLIDDANRVLAANGQMANLSIDSFADVVQAIHIVQEEMGIAGATAQEAADTISGSAASMKAAWENLVVGIADEDADIDTLIANFSESVSVAAENIIPRTEQVLIGIGDLITNLAPVAVDAVSELTTNVLPSALKAGASLLVAVGEGITSNFDNLLQTASDLVLYLTDSLIEGADGVIDGAVQIVQSLATWIEEYSDVLIEKAVVLIMTLVEGIAQNLPEIVLAAARIIAALATGLIKHLPDLVKKIPEIVVAIVDGFADAAPEFASVGKDIVRGIWEGIKSLGGWIGGNVKGFLGDIVDGAKNLLGIHSESTVFSGMGKNMVLGLEKGWDDNIGQARREISRGLDFGSASIDYSASAVGRIGSAMTGGFSGQPNTIVVQSVLDGRVIGETAYQYSRDQQRAYGW